MFTHSRNSQFQYLFFIAGSCYTADEAYRVLLAQREDRAHAVKMYEIGELRREAARLRIKAVLDNPATSEPERLEAKASMLEMQTHEEMGKTLYEEAIRERDFLDKLITMIEPHRQYANLPPHEAMQACQREEWRMRLIARAENYLVTSGTIPANELATMRAHPDFHEAILPHIQKVVDILDHSKDPADRNKALCAPQPLIKRIEGLEKEISNHPLLLPPFEKQE